MKKVLFILGMLLSLGMFSACSSDDDFNIESSLSDMGISEKTEITQELAWQIVKLCVLKNQLDNIDVYVSKDTVHPKTTIECYYSTELSPNYTSWIFFIDDVPFGNWSHLCRYVYVNAIGGKYEIHENTWLPTSLGSEFIPLVQTPPEPWDESKYSIPVLQKLK